MAEITLRVPLGRPLTYQEVDDNFKSVQELTLLAQQFALTAQEASTLADAAKNEAIAAKDEALVASGSAALDAQRAEDAADRAEAIADFDGLHNTLAGRNEPGAHDASAIGFKQEGVGAVDQSAEDFFKSFVMIEGFGAKFDGVTNDTQAWVDATNFCRENSKDLRLPAGVSLVDPDVIDISGVNLYGVARGYFNRQGTIIEGTSRTGVLFDQKSYGASRITTHWEGILFRKCNVPARWGYLVNSSFHKVFVEDSDDTFHFGRPDVLGTLWCRWSECQTNVQGRGFVMSGKDMANNNLFVNCMFRGGEPSLLTASSGYGAISNTFINTEFRHSVGKESGGIELGRTENTTFINPYFESNGPSIIANGLNRNVHLINPVFSITRSLDPETDPAAYVLHESGNFNIKIDGGRIYANDVPDQKGLSLIRSKSSTIKPFITVVSPTSVLVSNGSQASLGFSMFRDVPFENIRGEHVEEVETERDGIHHKQTLTWTGRAIHITGSSEVMEENSSTLPLAIPIHFSASAAKALNTGGVGRILYSSGTRRFVRCLVTSNTRFLQFNRESNGTFIDIQFNNLSVGTSILYSITIPL